MTSPWLIASWISVPLTGAHFLAYRSLTTTTSAGISSNVTLNHEEVEVAAIVRISTCARAEQDHPHRR